MQVPPDKNPVAAKDEPSRTAKALARRIADPLFLDLLFHDLRSPLNVISGYASMLDQVFGDRVQSREFASEIQSGAARQSALIERVLILTRLAAGRSSPANQSFSCSDLEICLRQRIGAGATGQAVKLDFAGELGGLTFRGDTQLIAEAVGCAHAYARGTGRADLSCRYSDEPAQALQFEIRSDAGSGQPTLEWHFADLWAVALGGSFETRTDNGGTVFRLTLPVQASPSPTVPRDLSLAALPTALRHALDEAAARCDADALTALLGQVAETDPSLAGHLEKLIDQFAFAEIGQLTSHNRRS